MREHRARRIIRIREIDQPRLFGDRALELIPIRLPIALDFEREAPHGGAEALRHAAVLHIVGNLERDLVARLDQRQRQQVIRFGGAVGDLDVVRPSRRDK